MNATSAPLYFFWRKKSRVLSLQKNAEIKSRNRTTPRFRMENARTLRLVITFEERALMKCACAMKPGIFIEPNSLFSLSRKGSKMIKLPPFCGFLFHLPAIWVLYAILYLCSNARAQERSYISQFRSKFNEIFRWHDTYLGSLSSCHEKDFEICGCHLQMRMKRMIAYFERKIWHKRRNLRVAHNSHTPYSPSSTLCDFFIRKKNYDRGAEPIFRSQ